MPAESNPYSITVAGLPVLSGLVAINITDVGADLLVSTTGSTGVIYYVADPAVGTPSAAQIIAGKTAGGAAAVASGNWTVSAPGQQPLRAVGGFLRGAAVYVWAVHTTAGGNSGTASSSFVTLGARPGPVERETVVSFYRRPDGANNKVGG